MASPNTLAIRQERLYDKNGRPTRLLLRRKLVELHQRNAVKDLLTKAAQSPDPETPAA